MASATKPDLDEFLKMSRPKRRPCAVGVALAALDEREQAQLAAACATDPGIITNSAVIQWMAGRGHEASNSAITSHRRQTCTCNG